MTLRRASYLLLITLLLVAFFFRVHELAGLGLGLEHDEVAEWLIADGIRHGNHALFFGEAFGQEPLFLYLMTGSITFIGDNVIGVRFTSVFVAMLTLAAAYRLLRRMFSPTAALVALAGMSVALWPVFWGRVGLRAMTLPLMMCLGFDWLWRGLMADGRWPMADGRKCFVLAGLFVGLSAYTYLSSRAIPILLLVFAIYLLLFARDRMRGRWRNFGVFFGVAALVALPLASYLLANPDLQFRVSEVSEPLDQALAGDARGVIANIPRALGMFTTRGDGTVRDNWPDRPVFPEPIGALLFNAGFVIALTRLRQPRYALALIWIGALLIPTIVTTGAPNFTRAIGALPMAFALPGIAVEWLTFWPLRLIMVRNIQSAERILAPIFILALLGVFAANAASTYDDYFNKWPQHQETQFVFQADFAAIAKDIDAGDVMDVSVGGLSNDTLDDPSLYLLRNRKDVRVRWFDSGSPISSGGAALYSQDFTNHVYTPSIVPVAQELERRLVSYWPFVDFDHFRRYEAHHIFDGEGSRPPKAIFDDSAELLLARYLPQAVSAGSNFRFETLWSFKPPVGYPRRIFAHMVDPGTGQIVAQHDGLDAPTKFWRLGDRIAQIHILHVPLETPLGQYELRVGLYDPTTSKRVLQTDSSHSEPPSDHVVLGTIAVTQ
jgi:4-amino-4-deoxy-L-arabinose transferase-like glycosyltransferase